MKGFYFVNTDIRNTRAHTIQILNTVSSITLHISLEIVVPRYANNINIDSVIQNHGLSASTKILPLWNFGIKSVGIVAFILFNIPSIFYLIKQNVVKKADFIYIRSSLFFPLAIASRIMGIPIFYETHRVPLSKGEKFRDYIMCKMSRAFIVISNYVGDQYKKYNKKILTAHDAVSLNKFISTKERNDIRKILGFASDEILCVYTGSISRIKGVECILEAAKLLPRYLFLLVGSVASEYLDMNWPSNVYLLGKKEHQEIPDILRSADVLLLPHPKNEYSQSPMKLFEYMTSKVPIVASKLPWIGEILNDSNAILIEVDNDNALAIGIKKIIDNRVLATKISNKAYRDVYEHTWDNRGYEISKFIRDNIK